MLNITFFHTLYNKEVTWKTDEVQFENGKVIFPFMGRKQSVDVVYVRSIISEEVHS